MPPPDVTQGDYLAATFGDDERDIPSDVPRSLDRHGLVRRREELEADRLAGVAGARDNQVETAHNSIAELGALERQDALPDSLVGAQR
jgi:hypothetical protein